MAQEQLQGQQQYYLQGATTLKEEGNALHRQGKYEEAAVKYQAAKGNVESQASSPAQQSLLQSCCLNLASCYLKTGQHDKVVEEASVVVNMDKNNLKALYRRGLANEALGRLAMAEEDLANAAKAHPNDEHVATALSSVRSKRGTGGSESEGGGDDVSSGLAALAAAMGGSKSEEKEEETKAQPSKPSHSDPDVEVLEPAPAKEEGPLTRGKLTVLGLKDLKTMCKERGLDTSGCVDKHDMIDLLMENPDAKPVKASEAPKSPSAAHTPSTPASAPAMPMGGMGGGAPGAMPDPAQAAEMMKDPKFVDQASQMAASMSPETLVAMARAQGRNMTVEQAKHQLDMMKNPAMMQQAQQMMSNMSPEQLKQAMAMQGGAAAAAAAAGARGAGAASNPSGRIDPEEIASAPAGAGMPGMPGMPQDPESIKKSIDAMDPETMAKMLQASPQAKGMNVTPEMAKMSMEMMKNMSPEDMQNMMKAAQAMQGGGGMGAGGPGGAAAAAGAAGGAGMPGGAGGMPRMGANGMPEVTPEMQAQMSNMMKDPAMMKSMTQMMKNMDPEMMKQFGITDKAQLEQAAAAMEKLSPEQMERMMGVAMFFQNLYLKYIGPVYRYYQQNLWAKAVFWILVLSLLWWMFGGWIVGSSAVTTAETVAAAGAAGAAAGAGGAESRDWSGTARASLEDVDDDEDERPQEPIPRSGASKVLEKETLDSDDDDDEL